MLSLSQHTHTHTHQAGKKKTTRTIIIHELLSQYFLKRRHKGIYTLYNHCLYTIIIASILLIRKLRLKEMDFPNSSSGKESACQWRRYMRHRFNPGLERSPGEGNGYPLQYSCLENSMVTNSWTRLSSHAILLIRELRLIQDNTDCSWQHQDSNSGLFYSKVLLTWEQENHFPIILSPLLPLKPFLNELWDPCEKIKTKMIKCLLLLLLSRFSRVRLCATP